MNVLRGNGSAWVTASPYDIGQPVDVFDGDPATLYRSAAVNPAFVQVAFAAPVSYTGFQVLLQSAWGDPAYRWKVEVANSQADMDARTGSFAEVVPFTDTVSDQISAVVLERPVSARLVRLTANRLTGDDYVHIGEWRIAGRTPFDVLDGPRGLAASPTGTVYVAESGRDRVVAFGPDGRRGAVIGTSGSANGQLRQPWDVAVVPGGTVAVADRGNDRVQVFDPSGAFVRAFGGSGQARGRLSGPAGIAVQDRAGGAAPYVYVADTGNQRVQRFWAGGILDRSWGSGGVVGVTGVVKRDHTGFDRPTDVAVEPVTGNVFVADFGNARLEVFDQRGRYIRTVHAVYRPNGLAFGPAGELYIAGEDPNDGYTAYDGRLRVLPPGEPLVSRHYTGGPDDISRVEGGVTVRADTTVVFTDVLHGRLVETDQALTPPVSDLRIRDAGKSVTLRWRTRLPGVGAVRYGTVPGEFTLATEATSGTRHDVTITGRTPNSRLYYGVSFTDPFNGSRRFTPLDVVNTGAPAGRTAFLRIKAVGVIYTDVDPAPGYQAMAPSRLAEARARFRDAARFYWRNSGFRLWLDITLVEVDRDLVGSPSLFEAMEGDLAAAGYSAASDLDAAWGASPLTGGNFGGGGTLFGRAVGMAEWTTEDNFVAIHEMNHSIDTIYAWNDLNKYEFNHGIWAVPGSVGRDFTVNAQILRNMLPANFTAVRPPFTKVMTARDADGDSVPDTSPAGLTVPLAMTEATLGSATTRADTDRDGLSDLAEAMALPFHGTNPKAADTDRDGTPDGTDRNPAYPVADRIAKGTPVIDGTIDPGGTWTILTDRYGFTNDALVPDSNAQQARVTTYAAWDDRYLYLGLKGPGTATEVRLDGGADNMFYGPANYWLTVGNAVPLLSVRNNVGVPDLFRQIDDHGQYSEFFDTDPQFTKEYNGRPIVNQPDEGLGFPGRLVTESDLRYAWGGSGDQSVWEVAIPWSNSTHFVGLAGRQLAIGFDVSGDLLFETDHQPRIELTP